MIFILELKVLQVIHTAYFVVLSQSSLFYFFKGHVFLLSRQA